MKRVPPPPQPPGGGLGRGWARLLHSAGPDGGIFGAARERLVWWPRGAGTPEGHGPMPAGGGENCSGQTRWMSRYPGVPTGTGGSDPHLSRCEGQCTEGSAH